MVFFILVSSHQAFGQGIGEALHKSSAKTTVRNIGATNKSSAKPSVHNIGASDLVNIFTKNDYKEVADHLYTLRWRHCDLDYFEAPNGKMGSVHIWKLDSKTISIYSLDDRVDKIVYSPNSDKLISSFSQSIERAGFKGFYNGAYGNGFKSQELILFIQNNHNDEISSILLYKKGGIFDNINEKWGNAIDNNETNTPMGNMSDEDDSDEVVLIPDEYPSFYGGDNELYKYMLNNVRYPEKARESGISGKVFVLFIVEKDGSISNVQVKRDLGGGCGEEAIRVVENMPKWKPAKVGGKIVRSQFILPVIFKDNQ